MGPRQLAFVFADSPQGDKARSSQDESYGKRFLVHTAKGSGRMESATCTAVERRLMESVASAGNLARALLNVLRNKGAPGVDGRSVEQVVDEAPALLPELQKSLLEGTYQPGDIRRVWIPKPDGTMRPLGIPTVLDRVIQQAVAQVLGPLFEVDFSEHSYGYRPGRSAQMAVAVMEESWKEGRRHAVECDLKSFFDTVNHDRLMRALLEKIRCRKVLGLIRR